MLCRGLKPRYIEALTRLGEDEKHFLVLGEFPRGIGYGILAELMRRGLTEMGISERFRGKAGWRITALGLHCLASRLAIAKAADRPTARRWDAQAVLPPVWPL